MPSIAFHSQLLPYLQSFRWVAPVFTYTLLLGGERFAGTILLSVHARISPSLAWIQLGCWGCAVASKLYLAFVGPGYVSLPAAGAFKCKCAARKPLVVKNSNNYLDVPACPTCGPTACENCGGLPSALWCATCERPKPATAEHCFVCNKCVDHYDHHCNLIDNCIGGRNYYAFVSLLGCSLGAIATGCACTILYVHDTVKHVTLTFTCHPYPGNTPIVFLVIAGVGLVRCTQQRMRGRPDRFGYPTLSSLRHGTWRDLDLFCCCCMADWMDVWSCVSSTCRDSPQEFAKAWWGLTALVSGSYGALKSCYEPHLHTPPGLLVSPLLPLQLICAGGCSFVLGAVGVPFLMFHLENLIRGTTTKLRWRRRRLEREGCKEE